MLSRTDGTCGNNCGQRGREVAVGQTTLVKSVQGKHELDM